MATILIVDDHALNRQFLLALLGFGQHRLLEAADGVQALHIATAEVPALIITDIMMPNMDGYQFVTALRANPALATIPVIFYTATYSLPQASAMAQACGVHWVLHKPATPDAIMTVVGQALGLAPARRLQAAPSSVPARFASTGQHLAHFLHEVDASNTEITHFLDELNTDSGDIAGSADHAALADPGLARVAQRLSQSLADFQTVGLRLTALVDMGLELATERDPQRLIESGCKIARHMGLARFVALGVPAPDGATYLHFATRGLDPEAAAALAAAPPHGLFRKVLANRRPQRRHGLAGNLEGTGLGPDHPVIDSLMVLPIASPSRNYGWLYLADKQGADRFSDVDEEMLMAVAAQIGVAYENLMLFERIRLSLVRMERESEARARMRAVLREREAGLQRAQAMSKLAHVISGPDGVFESWSQTLPALLGVDRTGLPGSIRAWLDIVHPAQQALIRHYCIMAGHSAHREMEYRVRHADQRWIVLRHVFEPLSDALTPEEQARWFHTIQDVTEQREQQQKLTRLSRIHAMKSGINGAIVRIPERRALLQEAARFAVTLGAFSMAWVGLVDPSGPDGGGVTWLGESPAQPENDALMQLAGVAARELRSVTCNDIGVELAGAGAALCAAGHHALVALPLIVAKRAVGVLVLFAGERDFFVTEELRLLEELASDLSFGLEYIDKDERLSFLAQNDALTGLPNRMRFHERLTRLLCGREPAMGLVCVAVINLDRFSQLNDALGRHVGDAVLRMVAERLSAGLPESSIPAHLGGDTFTVALTGLQRGVDAAALVEHSILELLEPVFRHGAHELRIAARAGLALYPDDGADAETLLKHAELALKKAKSSGVRALYYAPQMNAALAARLALEGALRVALKEQQFSIHYQPRVDLNSGRIVSAEALIRWQHPQRGWVPPVQFIPLCEETGLILPIGDWVIAAVCAQQAAWRADGFAIVPVAVNLSALQLKKGKLLRTISDALGAHSLEQTYLEFELTESMMMDDPEQAVIELQALKALGAVLSLDDFGTGYSSLAYLQRFPFDFVKIDRSFVSNITSNPGDAAIVNAIIAMAHSLHLQVVAEGVETEDQLRYLSEHGCDQLQGYFFSPPVTPDEFAAMLRAEKRLALPWRLRI